VNPVCGCPPGRNPFSRGGLGRRGALRATGVGFVATLAGILTRAGRVARAQPVTAQVPVVDRVSVRIVTDAYTDPFTTPPRPDGIRIEPAGRAERRGVPPRATLRAEWGLSMLAESARGDETRRVLIDFGYSPEVLLTNLGLLCTNAVRYSRTSRRSGRGTRRPTGMTPTVARACAARATPARRTAGRPNCATPARVRSTVRRRRPRHSARQRRWPQPILVCALPGRPPAAAPHRRGGVEGRVGHPASASARCCRKPRRRQRPAARRRVGSRCRRSTGARPPSRGQALGVRPAALGAACGCRGKPRSPPSSAECRAIVPIRTDHGLGARLAGIAAGVRMPAVRRATASGSAQPGLRLGFRHPISLRSASFGSACSPRS
jgi:hypothetical protein